MSSDKGHAESPLPQQRLEHLNAVLRAIRSVNQLIVHEKDPDALIQQACGLLVETRGYYSAWIALLDDEGNLRTAVESGLGEAFQAMAEQLQRGEFTARVRRALAETGVHVVRAPVKECLDCPLSHSYEGRSGMTIRLEHRGETYGLMSVSVPAEYAQDDEEAELLQEVAGDIAYAVHNLAVEESHNRAVEALRESEEKFRSLFEHSVDAITLVAPTGRFLEVNQAWHDLYGYSRDELPGLSGAEMYANPEEREAFLRRMAETGFVEDEVRLKKKDGTVMDCQRIAVARRDEHGNMIAFQGITRDITERKRAEEKLRVTGERLELAMDAGEHGFWDWNLDTNEMFFSPRYYTMLGYENEELPMVLDTWASLMHPEDRETVVPEVQKHVENAEPYEIEFRLRCKDGSWKWISGRGKSFELDEKGVAHRVVGLHVDITERRSAERERERLLGQLEEKTKELEQIVFVSSHDLRSPLVNIQGFTNEAQGELDEIRELLQGEKLSPAGRKRILELLEHEIPEAFGYVLAGSNKIDSLLAGLLRMSRLGRAALQIERLDMNKLLGEVTRAFEFRIKEAGATVRVEELPACMGDRVQVDQVFSNLLDNALKFLDPQRRGEITITGTEEGEEPLYCVEDNGVGIAQEYHERIFEIFQSLGRGEDRGEGLGLSIVQRILGRHGGKVRVESTPGHGSRFYVSLPADKNRAERKTE